MTQKITQKEINQVVWSACDTFRGIINPQQYMDYILTMLFLKYVSDIYKERFVAHLDRYNGDTERAARAMKRERFEVDEESSFDFLYDNRNATNIGELINIALNKFESGKNQNRLRDEDIKHIVETYRNFAAGDLKQGVAEDKFAYVATRAEIEENDYNLNIPRYVDTYEEEGPIDIKEVQSEIDSLEEELAEVQAKMKGYLTELGY